MEITDIENRLMELPKEIEQKGLELEEARIRYENEKLARDVEYAKQTLIVSITSLSESAKRAKVFGKLEEKSSKLLKFKSKVRILQISVRRLETELDVLRELLRLEVAKMKLV